MDDLRPADQQTKDIKFSRDFRIQQLLRLVQVPISDPRGDQVISRGFSSAISPKISGLFSIVLTLTDLSTRCHILSLSNS